MADHHNANDEAREKDEKLRVAFGRGGDEHSNSGSLVFTDARLVCLPVRSLYGTFAWCTSPMALRRLVRDLKSAGAAARLGAIPEPEGDQVVLLGAENSVLKKSGSGSDSAGRVFLEDLDFEAQSSPQAAGWAAQLGEWVFAGQPSWQQEFQRRFLVVPEDVFSFLCETGTEVAARIRLEDETKIVAQKALWYEESLPAETILAGMVWCDRIFSNTNITRDQLLQEFCTGELLLQMGGNATVGRGRVRFLFSNGEPNHAG